VKLFVSRGNLKRVPDLVGPGFTKDQAIGALRTNGFDSYEVVPYDTGDPKLDGKVVQQNPDANSLQDPTKVKVTIMVAHYVGATTTPTTTPPAGGG
jgi:beta-lactam-binding protein with PASTA domain